MWHIQGIYIRIEPPRRVPNARLKHPNIVNNLPLKTSFLDSHAH